MAPTPDWQRDLAIVHEIMRDVSLQSEPQELVRVYSQGVRRLREVDRLVSVSRRALDKPWYRITRDSREANPADPWRHRDRLPLLDRGYLGQLLYDGTPRIVRDLSVIPPDDPTRPYFDGMRAFYTLPQWDNGEVLNMSLIMFEDPSKLDETQYPNLLWQANLFGRTTANLVLRKELREAYDRLDHEMQIVGEIQRSLLPRDLPNIPGLDLAAHYQTSTQAGGDYYDLFALPGGQWGVFIGDVSGHGTPAAVLMAVTHAIAHAYPGPCMPPAGVMGHLNTILSRHYTNGNGAFVTALYGVYDPQNRTLTYARAGHNPPRLKSRAGITPIEAVGSLPLGILPDTSYSEAMLQLHAGDTILFYTDGVTEAQNVSGDLFGEDRLDAALAANGGTAASLIDRVLSDLRAFEGTRPAADDRTLLAMRLTT